MSLDAAARVVLRPIGNPLPLGFLALAGGTVVVSGLQLAWVEPSEGDVIALIVLAFAFPLQLLASESSCGSPPGRSSCARRPPRWASSSPLPSSRSPRRFALTGLYELTSSGAWEGRQDPADLQLARAALALALAREERRAGELLDGLSARDRPEPVATALAQTAILLKRFVQARDFLPTGAEGEAGLLRAEASVFLGETEGLQEAVAALDALIDGPDELRYRAAFSRLVAATITPTVPWSEPAEALVAAEHAWTVAMLRAERLADAGDVASARALLLPHSDRAPVLRYLIELAERESGHAEALRLSRELLGRAPDERDRLRHAGLLARAGDREAADREFLVLARDPALSTDARLEAFRRAAQAANRKGEYRRLGELAAEWYAFGAEEDAVWLEVFALARQTRYGQALERWRRTPLPPMSEEQGYLVGEIFARAASPVEATAKLAELSERFGRSEAFEFNLITYVLLHKREGLELPEHLAARVAESFESFAARFPDSRRLRAETFDPTDPVAGIVTLVRETWETRSALLRELEKGVGDGTTPVCVLASAAGRAVGETWLRLPALPLAFGDEDLHRLERADAAAALEQRGAVWAPSAIHVAGGLGAVARGLLRGLVPASIVAQATLDEAAGDLAADDRERAELAWDPVGGAAILVEWPEAEVRRDQERREGTLALARELTVRPDRDPDSDDDLEGLLDEDLDRPVRTCAASLAVARREGLALYSDDRYERIVARQLGLPTFGTAALLDVLLDREQLEPDDHARLRARLLRTGAWGLRPSARELAELARDADWELTAALRAALLDRASWRADPTSTLGVLAELLGLCAAEAPEQLPDWVARTLDAPSLVFGAPWDTISELLLSLVLTPDPIPPAVTPEGARLIVQALRDLRYFKLFPPGRDVVLTAVANVLSAADAQDENFRALFFGFIVDRLPEPERDSAIATFVR